jgi:hypothetical protein
MLTYLLLLAKHDHSSVSEHNSMTHHDHRRGEKKGEPLYEKGDFSTLWWLPATASTAKVGQQVAVRGTDSTMAHLIFVPAGSPPTAAGWPLIVFLHGQG